MVRKMGLMTADIGFQKGVDWGVFVCQTHLNHLVYFDYNGINDIFRNVVSMF